MLPSLSQSLCRLCRSFQVGPNGLICWVVESFLKGGTLNISSSLNVSGDLVLATNSFIFISGSNAELQAQNIRSSNNSRVVVGGDVLVLKNVTLSNTTLTIRENGNLTVLGSFALDESSTLSLTSNSTLDVKGWRKTFLVLFLCKCLNQRKRNSCWNFGCSSRVKCFVNPNHQFWLVQRPVFVAPSIIDFCVRVSRLQLCGLHVFFCHIVSFARSSSQLSRVGLSNDSAGWRTFHGSNCGYFHRGNCVCNSDNCGAWNCCEEEAEEARR